MDDPPPPEKLQEAKDESAVPAYGARMVPRKPACANSSCVANGKFQMMYGSTNSGESLCKSETSHQSRITGTRRSD